MPNQVHLLVTPRIPIAKLTRRLKGYTAREANRLLGQMGEAFWQPESCDHWVRIENNPAAAELAVLPEGYPWSSAAPSISIRRQSCRRGGPGGPLHNGTPIPEP